MRLLLDTHTFLWAISDEPRLGPGSRDLITTEASSVLISHGSLWEIAIKHALALSDMPLSAAQAIPFDRLLVASRSANRCCWSVLIRSFMPMAAPGRMPAAEGGIVPGRVHCSASMEKPRRPFRWCRPSPLCYARPLGLLDPRRCKGRCDRRSVERPVLRSAQGPTQPGAEAPAWAAHSPRRG